MRCSSCLHFSRGGLCNSHQPSPAVFTVTGRPAPRCEVSVKNVTLSPCVFEELQSYLRPSVRGRDGRLSNGLWAAPSK